jgi:hypothetical protein
MLGLLAPALAVGVESHPAFLLVPPTAAAEPDSSTLQLPLAGILGRVTARSTDSTDTRAHGFLTIDAGPGMSLLCDASYGLTAALADVDRHCLLGRLDGNGWNLGQATRVGIDHQLSFGDEQLPFDVSFGLSWLRADVEQPFAEPSLNLFDERFQPSPGLLEEISGETVTLAGTQWLSERSWLRVTGSSSRFRSDRPLLAGPLNWTSSALRVDAGFGAFAGSLTGHRTDSRQAARSWFDIDLGVSWRTPWQGRLTVGARNLLGQDEAHLGGRENDAASRLMEARTPYVRYQQDL